jgi:hypothetical protein
MAAEPQNTRIRGLLLFGVYWALDWTGLDWTGLDWTGLDWTGLDWAALGWTGLHWTGLHWTGLHWTGLHWTGLHWTGLHWTGLGCTGLDWALDWTGHWTGLDWTGLHGGVIYLPVVISCAANLLAQSPAATDSGPVIFAGGTLIKHSESWRWLSAVRTAHRSCHCRNWCPNSTGAGDPVVEAGAPRTQIVPGARLAAATSPAGARRTASAQSAVQVRWGLRLG